MMNEPVSGSIDKDFSVGAINSDGDDISSSGESMEHGLHPRWFQELLPRLLPVPKDATLTEIRCFS